MKSSTRLLLAAAALAPLIVPTLSGQNRIGTGPVTDIYREHCASCHGEDLAGGLGGSLLEGPWQHGSSSADMTRIIRDGLPNLGMEAYGGVLSDQEIRALVIFIEEMRAKHDAAPPSTESGTWSPDTIFSAGDTKFRLETVATADEQLWGIDFLPDDRIIVTQLNGQLRIFADGKLGPAIKGTPEVAFAGQGGLLDVGVHPDYAENGWIYLSYSEKNQVGVMTTVVRGRIKDGTWTDEEVLFRAKPDDYLGGGAHFGSRFVFLDGYVYFSIGDRGKQALAQDLNKPNGKIHRIHDDGRVPEDNPFVNTPNAYPTIWSYGHRNPQGLTLRPGTSEIWSAEHGPRGGDEINLIEKGKNYGWPVITYGMNYNGTPITEKTAQEGMEQPVLYYVPSIGICAIAFYEGDKFPEWNDSLFVTGLSAKVIRRVSLDGQSEASQEIVFSGLGRMRDVATGPDGFPYALLNDPSGDRAQPGQIVRLVPNP